MKIQLKHITAFLILFIFTVNGFSQTLEGTIVSEEKSPIEYANVVLLSLPDSSFIAGTITDEKGHFSIRQDKNGKLLRISAVGYANHFQKVNSSNIGTIQLKTDVRMLTELTVKGDLPHTQIKDDALVTVIEGSILERAGTLAQVLQKIPNVTVNGESVNVFGRGVPEIYVNSRKIRDNAELSQISADQVQAIEVITNPGARYDAQVTAVIRIRTKKATGEGFSFSDRAYVRHNMKKLSALNQFDFNYRKDGFDLSGMLDTHHINSREESNDPIYLYLPDLVWKQDQYTMGNSPNRAISGRLSANYTFNNEQAIGVRYDGMKRGKATWKGYMNSIQYMNDVFYDKTEDTNSVTFPETRHSLNVYYLGKVGNVKLDWNTDFFIRERDRNQIIQEHYEDATGVKEDGLIESLTNTKNKLAASKLIATTPWGLSLGAEFAYSDQQNDFRNPQQIMESNYTELYERAYSAFAEYTATLGKVRLQAGLRYENINSDYYQNHVRNTDSSKNYSNLFPTVSVTAPIGKAQWSLRYSQGIRRPSYSQLRGSVSYLGRYAYEAGNPMLIPTMTTDISTALSYKWLQAEVGYHHYENPIFYLSKLLREDDLITYVYYDNAPAYSKVTAQVNATHSWGCWTPRWGIAVEKQWIDMDSPWGPVKLNKPFWTFTWQNTLNLPHEWLFSWDMLLETKGHQQSAYNFRNNLNVTASLIKTLLKNRLTLQLDGNNIFNTYQADPCLQYCGKLIMLELGRVRMSSVTFTARYKFNVSGSKYKGTGAGQSQRSRM